MPASLNTSLSDEELDELSNFLESIPGAMSIEMFDGFLAALVCSPDLVLPSVYYPHVWGEDHAFDSMEEATKYSGMLVRHWNSISADLNANKFDPVFIDHEDSPGVGNEWAKGFMQGVQLGGPGWNDLFEDEENGGVLVPILALAHEHDPDPEMRPEPIDDDRRDLMLASIAAYLPIIYKYFAKHREQASLTPKRNTPVQRAGRKIGRNEPCPCGSKRKYKYCCGKN